MLLRSWVISSLLERWHQRAQAHQHLTVRQLKQRERGFQVSNEVNWAWKATRCSRFWDKGVLHRRPNRVDHSSELDTKCRRARAGYIPFVKDVFVCVFSCQGTKNADQSCGSFDGQDTREPKWAKRLYTWAIRTKHVKNQIWEEDPHRHKVITEVRQERQLKCVSKSLRGTSGQNNLWKARISHSQLNKEKQAHSPSNASFPSLQNFSSGFPIEVALTLKEKTNKGTRNHRGTWSHSDMQCYISPQPTLHRAFPWSSIPSGWSCAKDQAKLQRSLGRSRSLCACETAHLSHTLTIESYKLTPFSNRSTNQFSRIAHSISYIICLIAACNLRNLGFSGMLWTRSKSFLWNCSAKPFGFKVYPILPQALKFWGFDNASHLKSRACRANRTETRAKAELHT